MCILMSVMKFMLLLNLFRLQNIYQLEEGNEEVMEENVDANATEDVKDSNENNNSSERKDIFGSSDSDCSFDSNVNDNPIGKCYLCVCRCNIIYFVTKFILISK